MAIFLKEIRIQLSDEEIKALNLKNAYYYLSPITLIPNPTLPTVTNYPYNLYIEKYGDSETAVKRLGLIYLTRHELKLIEEQGVTYFKKLLERSDMEAD